jgi:hypothetical protein
MGKGKKKKRVSNGVNKRGAKLAMDPAVNVESRTIRNCKKNIEPKPLKNKKDSLANKKL